MSLSAAELAEHAHSIGGWEQTSFGLALLLTAAVKWFLPRVHDTGSAKGEGIGWERGTLGLSGRLLMSRVLKYTGVFWKVDWNVNFTQRVAFWDRILTMKVWVS